MKNTTTIILKLLCLIVLLFTVPVSTTTADDAFTLESRIDIENKSLNWKYIEVYEKDRSYLIKQYIDANIGNRDGFVSAWELHKADKVMRQRLHDNIMQDMNVQINGSYDGIYPVNVDTELSHELIGRINRPSTVRNLYIVEYEFREFFYEMGSEISFSGMPGTQVSITMPETVEVTTVSGMENKTSTKINKITYITGEFGYQGPITVHYNHTHMNSEDSSDTSEDNIKIQKPIDIMNEFLKIYVLSL